MMREPLERRLFAADAGNGGNAPGTGSDGPSGDGDGGGGGGNPPAAAADSGQQPAGQAPAGGQQPQGGDDPFAWMGDANLTDQDRHYLEAKRFSKPADLYKSLRNAEKAIRGNVMPAPPENPEQRAEWYKDAGVAQALGIPEEPTGYGVEPPKFDDAIKDLVAYDDARHGRFLEAAHQLNLTPQQVEGVLGMWAEEVGQDAKSYEAARIADETEADAALKRDWGQDYDQRKAAAVETAVELGLTDAEAEALRTSGVAGSAKMFKILDELAQVRGNDGLKGGGRGGGGMTPESAAAELDTFEKKHRNALVDKRHTDHEWAKSERAKLRAAAGRGSAGRAA